MMVAAKIKQGLGLEFGGDVSKAIKSCKMLFWHIIGLDWRRIVSVSMSGAFLGIIINAAK